MNVVYRFKANFWFALILLAGLLSVVGMHARGAYADDFLFLHYLSTRSIVEAFTEWHFNSRWTQALLIPLLYQPALAAQGLGGWWPIHGLALLSLLAIAIAVERSLALTGFSIRSRALLLGIFLIHPGKAQAVFWAATIIGYVLPAAWVALAFWYHLHIAAKGRESALRLLPILLAYSSACLSLEQFVPYCTLLIALRLVAFRGSRGAWLRNASLLAGVAAIFLGATIAGSTGHRLAHHGGMGFDSVLGTVLEILWGTLETTIIGTLRVWLDPDLRDLLLPALTSWVTVVGVGAFVAAFAFIPTARAEERNSHRLVLVGLMLWWAPLSPLLVIDYYVPERVFFLSLIGLGMLGVCFLEQLLDRLSSKTLQLACVALLAVPLLVASRVRDAQFVQQWDYTRTLMKSIANTGPTVDDPMLVVAGFPRAIDPVPDVLYGRILDGLAATALQTPKASGRADPDLEFSIPELCTAPTGKTLLRTPRPGHHLWLWGHSGLIEVRALNFGNPAPAPEQAPGTSSLAAWHARDFHQIYNDGVSLSVPGVIRLPESDTLILCVSMDLASVSERGLRLSVHAVTKTVGRRVYDRDLTEKDDMFRHQGANWHRAFLVKDASQLAELSVRLIGHGERTEGPANVDLSVGL